MNINGIIEDIFGASEVELPDFSDYADDFGGEVFAEDYYTALDLEPIDFSSEEYDYLWDEIPTAEETNGIVNDWIPDPVITGETPPVVTTMPPAILNTGDSGIDVNSIVKFVTQAGGAIADAYFRYVRTTQPNGVPIYNPQQIPNPPPGTRYDASGRLVSTATGAPVRVNSAGQIVDDRGNVVSAGGVRYDAYGRPVVGSAGVLDNLPPWALPAGIAGIAALFLLSGSRKK